MQTYQAKNVTPYIHAMMNHVSEFMKLHGSILAFTQQGLEKYNDVITKDYFRATSHKGKQALLQIMQKRNRLEHLRDSGVQVPSYLTLHVQAATKRDITSVHAVLFSFFFKLLAILCILCTYSIMSFIIL